MPANQRQQTAKSQVPTQPTTSPASRATAKYTNKDGSKFITVPKPLDATLAAMAQPGARSNDQAPLTPTGTNGTAPTVNRKKQKRRQKQAAKLAAEGLAAVRTSSSHQNPDAHSRSQEHGYEESNEEHGQFDPAEGEAEYSDEEGSGSYGPTSPINGYVEPRGKKSKKRRSLGNLNSLKRRAMLRRIRTASQILILPTLPRCPFLH
ncbi:hypothetical protein B0O99DRAFT_182256 [Bisporella sp. PMI_857]|nr:hypothetical protein B0O99DRAFT_182256 [Bisporella sp. PMI_857]